MTDFDWLFDPPELETARTVKPRTLTRQVEKRETRLAMKRERAAEVLTTLPGRGATTHIVSNGLFDYWDFCPLIIDLLGGKVDSFYGSTWTMNRDNTAELLALIDEGKLTNVAILTGLYFKRREAAVYATLLDGLTQRGQRFLASKNHTKIMLFEKPPDYITVESSANWTANPRVEQTAISNDRILWEFHSGWMEGLFNDD